MVTVTENIRTATATIATTATTQELCESRGGRPGLPVPYSPYGLCGRKATLNYYHYSSSVCHTGAVPASTR